MHQRHIRIVFLGTLILSAVAYADDHQAKKCNSSARECEQAIRQMLSGRRYLGAFVEEVNGALRVTSISADSPAQRAGLGDGDRLMSVNGQSLLRADIKDFKRAVSNAAKDSGRLSLIVERGGILKKVDVRLEPYAKAYIDKIVAQHLAEAHPAEATGSTQQQP